MQRVAGNPDDILITWNRHGYKDALCAAFGGRVVVCEEGYTRHLHPVKHFAMSLRGHNGSGEWFPGNESRWRALGLELKPWRVHGDHILVCGQRGIGSALMASPPHWHNDCAARLAKYTERSIVVRPHPGKDRAGPSLASQLKDAWAVVVWSSACAVKALLEGIPVFAEAPHHILDGAVQRGIERIEAPTLTNRQDAFARMAWAQWTMDEIRAGEPFRHLLR